MVKRAVGTKACLLGKAVTCYYLRQDNFLEVMIIKTVPKIIVICGEAHRLSLISNDYSSSPCIYFLTESISTGLCGSLDK